MSSDEILEYFVQNVEETEISSSSNITLCMNGLIITGKIISSTSYYEKMFRFYDRLENTSTTDQSKIEAWHNYKERSKQFMEQMKSKHNTEKQGSPKYIHLANVEIYPSDLLSLPFPTDLWRGKLSSVDGFSLDIAEAKPLDRSQKID